MKEWESNLKNYDPVNIISYTVTDEAQKPVKNIQVKLRLLGFSPIAKYEDETGKYSYHSQDGHKDLDSLDIIVKDTMGVFEPDSVRVPVAYKAVKDPNDSWKEGESTAHHDFQLKKK